MSTLLQPLCTHKKATNTETTLHKNEKREQTYSAVLPACLMSQLSVTSMLTEFLAEIE